jgi:hypothetical protein
VAIYKVGDSFPVQFVWQLPEGDFVRAVFQAEVLFLVPAAEKYIVRLNQLVAGRQESERGEMRPKEALTKAYWALVGQIMGRKISLAYEAADGRPLHLRLATLTGEHNFFTRFENSG